LVVFEIGFREVAMQMRLANVVELSVNGPLEQSNEAFDRVGMVETASADILISRVVDRAVTSELAT
jgi:hypothetical protein